MLHVVAHTVRAVSIVGEGNIANMCATAHFISRYDTSLESIPREWTCYRCLGTCNCASCVRKSSGYLPSDTPKPEVSVSSRPVRIRSRTWKGEAIAKEILQKAAPKPYPQASRPPRRPRGARSDHRELSGRSGSPSSRDAPSVEPGSPSAETPPMASPDDWCEEFIPDPRLTPFEYLEPVLVPNEEFQPTKHSMPTQGTSPSFIYFEDSSLVAADHTLLGFNSSPNVANDRPPPSMDNHGFHPTCSLIKDFVYVMDHGVDGEEEGEEHVNQEGWLNFLV